MTLILVIPARDGIVMASDGQITSGMVRTTGEKIQLLNERCVWAASGELALIQRVEERIGMLPPNEPLVNLRDQIAQIVKQSVTELLNLDFRTPFFQKSPNDLLRLHPGDFVFAEFSPNPGILHITVNGTPEWIKDRSFASGNGDLFAYALLQKYKGIDLDIERASVLAYKVIEEAIEVGAYGLGPPVHIWQLNENGVRQLNESQIARISDTANMLRQAEIELFMKSMSKEG
ncbi:MAG: hypothetical protein DRG83_05815 [Deltaproteobacteria bacterium]|nr:MAG: hypothetical protein DRG83_05815 [Deltaproteobacteria bacterium]